MGVPVSLGVSSSRLSSSACSRLRSGCFSTTYTQSTSRLPTPFRDVVERRGLPEELSIYIPARPSSCIPAWKAGLSGIWTWLSVAAAPQGVCRAPGAARTWVCGCSARRRRSFFTPSPRFNPELGIVGASGCGAMDEGSGELSVLSSSETCTDAVGAVQRCSINRQRALIEEFGAWPPAASISALMLSLG